MSLTLLVLSYEERTYHQVAEVWVHSQCDTPSLSCSLFVEDIWSDKISLLNETKFQGRPSNNPFLNPRLLVAIPAWNPASLTTHVGDLLFAFHLNYFVPLHVYLIFSRLQSHLPSCTFALLAYQYRSMALPWNFAVFSNHSQDISFKTGDPPQGNFPLYTNLLKVPS